MSDQHYSQAAQNSSELSAQAAAAAAESAKYLVELLKYFASRLQPEERQELRLVSAPDSRRELKPKPGKEKGERPEVKIRIGRSNVFVGRLGQKPVKDGVDAGVVERLNTAITNPAESKGTVSIVLDNREVYGVRNGVVTVDKIDRDSLQAAIASVFNNTEPEQYEGADRGQVSPSATRPESSAPVARELPLSEIRTLIHSELVGVKKELDRVNARLAELERKIETGELVPATQIAARYLESLPSQQIDRGVEGLSKSLNAATSDIKAIRSQSGTVLQQKQEKLTESFSQRIARPFRRVREAIATKGAAATIAGLREEAFQRAAIQDIVQKANVLLKVEGKAEGGTISFVDNDFRILKDDSSLEILRTSNNSTVLKVSDGTVVENTVSIRDMASIGISSLDAVQYEVRQRRAAAKQKQIRARPTQPPNRAAVSRGR